MIAIVLCQLIGQGVPTYRVKNYMGITVEVFVDEINISLRKLSKADYLLQCGWTLTNH